MNIFTFVMGQFSLFPFVVIDVFGLSPPLYFVLSMIYLVLSFFSVMFGSAELFLSLFFFLYCLET